MWWTLVALILPLGVDTFAVSAALGITGLSRADRSRVTLLFTAFEMGMPLVGLLIGSLVGRAVGEAADYLAIAILIALGAYMLWPRGNEREDDRLRLLARTHGVAAIGLGISISLDELAIGLTLGLLRFPLILVILLIGLQTLIVTQLGLRLGRRIGEGIREGAERVAGIALAVLGVVLLLEKLVR